MSLQVLLAELRRDHELIEAMLGALRSYVAARARGAAPAADGPAFLAFFRDFAGAHHHAVEEEVLFPALVEHAELPAGRGPLHALRGQHLELGRTLDALEPLLGAERSWTAEAAARAETLARAYSHGLWRHIDAENSVLLPEAQQRLRQAPPAAFALPAVEPATLLAALRAEALLAAYPPAYDREALRGDGCIACPAYGEGCDGVEQEWWNEYEWEELPDRVG